MKLLLLNFKDDIYGENKNSQQKITMTLIQTILVNYIAHQMGKQGTHSAEVGALVPVSERSATEPKPNILRCKNIVNIESFNIRTLNSINQQQ